MRYLPALLGLLLATLLPLHVQTSAQEGELPPMPPREPRGPADPELAPARQAAFAKSPQHGRIKAALDWLRDHQNIEGYWSATEFRADSRRADAKATGNLEFVKPGKLDGDFGWKDDSDIGLTGLAMQAFASAGFDHRAGEYRQTLRMAMQYLRRVQSNDGCFGPKEDDHFVYNHAHATTAAAEIYALSGDAVLKPMIDRACDFILRAQNPGLGWRYGVQPGMNDTSVTGNMLYALHAAKRGGIEIEHEKMLKGAFTWLNMVTVEVEGKWKTGYDTPGSDNARLRSAMDYFHNATMDAIHGACAAMWDKSDDRYLPHFRERLLAPGSLPRWDHLRVDFYYWYWAAKFARMDGGELWQAWNTQATSVLTASQRGWHVDDLEASRASASKLQEHGSWDPVGAWGTAGGRVYSTAMGALILQTEWQLKR